MYKGTEAPKRARRVRRHPGQRSSGKVGRGLAVAARLSVLKFVIGMLRQVLSVQIQFDQGSNSVTRPGFFLSSLVCCFNPILRLPVGVRGLVPSSSRKSSALGTVQLVNVPSQKRSPRYRWEGIPWSGSPRGKGCFQPSRTGTFAVRRRLQVAE